MAWSNPQLVGAVEGDDLIADLGDGLGPDALVTVTLTKPYTPHHPPGYPIRPQHDVPIAAGSTIALIKPEAAALVAAGAANYGSEPIPPQLVDPPVNVIAPYCGGSGVVGEELTCTMGTWENEPTGYAYQWKIGPLGSMIPGATDPAYVPDIDNAGKPVFCTVTASNVAGKASSDSNKVNITQHIDTVEPLPSKRNKSCEGRK